MNQYSGASGLAVRGIGVVGGVSAAVRALVLVAKVGRRLEERIVLSEFLYVRFTPVVVKISSKLAGYPLCRRPARFASGGSQR